MVNYQSWTGFTDSRFGYGAMLKGFLDNIPDDVVLDGNASVQVHMGVPMSWKGWWDGQHRVCFTMWETTELPSSFRRYLPLYDQILVPCDHNVEVFGRHHRDVSAVPLGVDTSFWKPMRKTNDGVFRFHAAGSLWRRKGLDALVTAFEALKLPDAVLDIKAAPHARDVPPHTEKENISLNREWMNPIQLRHWFNQADCFVAPSRGEGFGLIPLQAIALGIPTIVTKTSGQTQFSHLATHPIGTHRIKSDNIGYWDEPNQQELKDAMMDVYRNRDRYRTQAKQNSLKATEFSWSNAARKLCAALPTGTLLTNPTWKDAFVNVTCTVIAPVNAQIGNHHYKAKPGETLTLPDGAYQVLYDAGAVQIV